MLDISLYIPTLVLSLIAYLASTQTHTMKYIFINYQNEVIHTEETDSPEETESFLVAIGFEVGGFQLA